MVTNVWLILLISHIFSKHQQIHIHDDFLKFEGTKNQWRRHLTPIKPYIGRKNFRRIVAWDRSPYLIQPKNQKKIKKEKKNSRPDYVLRRMSKEGWRGAELIFLLSKFVHAKTTVQYNSLWFPKFWSALLIGSCWGCACKICHIIC